MARGRWLTAAVATVASATLLGMAPSVPDASRVLDLEIRPVAGNFDSPLLVTNAGDGSGRLFVVERGGRVFVVKNGQRRERPWLDISRITQAGGEQGLLGLAFHPDFETNRRFYVNHINRSGNTVIARYKVYENKRGKAKPSSRRVILRIDQPYANHNGGDISFAPDGYLYIATGDGGSGGDPHNNGQRLDTLLGKILRIDVDARTGGRRYGIPSDNPLVGQPGRDEIWAYGLRNPWRFGIDREAGTIWIGDVGQDSLEEVNRQPLSAAGVNYGWNVMEGNECYPPGASCIPEGLVLPIATYDHKLGCAVTGGYVYRGTDYPEMAGVYFFGDYCSGIIWTLASDGESPQTPVQVLDTDHSISSFGESEDGELYMTDLTSGSLLQLVDSS
jgi:glucose/arabinose dehydrogenase